MNCGQSPSWSVMSMARGLTEGQVIEKESKGQSYYHYRLLQPNPPDCRTAQQFS